MEFCHQTFPQTSIDYNRNSVFPSKVKFDPHKLCCFSLHLGESINAVNKRGKKKKKKCQVLPENVADYIVCNSLDWVCVRTVNRNHYKMKSSYLGRWGKLD